MSSRPVWKLNCLLGCTPVFLTNTQTRLTILHICKITDIKRTVEICIVLLLCIEIQEVPYYLEKYFLFVPQQLLHGRRVLYTAGKAFVLHPSNS